MTNITWIAVAIVVFMLGRQTGRSGVFRDLKMFGLFTKEANDARNAIFDLDANGDRDEALASRQLAWRMGGVAAGYADSLREELHAAGYATDAQTGDIRRVDGAP